MDQIGKCSHIGEDELDQKAPATPEKPNPVEKMTCARIEEDGGEK